IVRNNQINAYYFGEAYKPKGFFPPEMAYSSTVAKVVQDLGFQWMILSEYAAPETLMAEGPRHPWKIAGTNLTCLIRDNPLSLHIAFNKVFSVPQFADLIREHYGEEGGAVTAIDGETFGHHNKGQE